MLETASGGLERYCLGGVVDACGDRDYFLLADELLPVFVVDDVDIASFRSVDRRGHVYSALGNKELHGISVVNHAESRPFPFAVFEFWADDAPDLQGVGRAFDESLIQRHDEALGGYFAKWWGLNRIRINRGAGRRDCLNLAGQSVFSQDSVFRWEG